MKKNIFRCPDCGKAIHTENRDVGSAPFVIGCTNENCEGMARSSFYMVEQNDESIVPDLVFIKPRNKKEWDIVWNELLKDCRINFPKKKERKLVLLAERIMETIKHHVQSGGLVHLPKEVFDAM